MKSLAVNADVVPENTRSRHTQEKVGFQFFREDENFKCYRCENPALRREKIIRDLMGKMVHVEIDRPVGYRHGDIIYPINYGYIPGVIAGDGEEQDAYVLGISEPLSAFDGRVIGAVRRRDDCEDKLIVAPDGKLYHREEIAQAVFFQEQYFLGTIESLLD